MAVGKLTINVHCISQKGRKYVVPQKLQRAEIAQRHSAASLVLCWPKM
jgi:hypothetical protein